MFLKSVYIRKFRKNISPIRLQKRFVMKKDKVWHAVYLENEYLKIMILPELGGRIQRAYDKTNDYDFCIL